MVNETKDSALFFRDSVDLDLNFSSVLPSGEKYIRSLYETGVISEVEAMRYFELLKDSQTIIPSINRAVISLETYRDISVEREDLRWAWGNFSDFLGTIQDDLKEKEMFVFVYGSMVFGDPINLDFDLLFLSRKQNESFRGEEMEMWEGELNEEYWRPRVVGSRGHATYISMEELDGVLERIRNDPDYIYDHAEDVQFSFGNFSTILGGRAVFSPETTDILKADASEDVKNLRHELMGKVGDHDILGATVAEQLERVLNRRKDRRV